MSSVSAFGVAASGTSIDRAELAREVAASEAANRPADVLRRCPECGSDRFTERPARGG